MVAIRAPPTLQCGHSNLPQAPRPMATVSFTNHLRDHAPDKPVEVDGATVREALDAVLKDRDRLRSYVFDEGGRLRRHVAVFVDGKLVADRVALSDPIGPASELFVMQALSGG